jgi:hypothetical protein
MDRRRDALLVQVREHPDAGQPGGAACFLSRIRPQSKQNQATVSNFSADFPHSEKTTAVSCECFSLSAQRERCVRYARFNFFADS